MGEQQHSIQQQILNIDFYDKANVQPLYATISNLFNSKIHDVTETIFNRHIPEDVIIKLDSLHVDVGTIDHAYFEQEFTERYQAALEQELLRQLQVLQHGGKNNIMAVTTKFNENYISFISYFLRSGTKPWWASGKKYSNISDIYALLLEEDSNQLKELLLNIGADDNVRYRMVYQLPQHSLQQTIHILEPAQAPFIFDYHASVINVQQKESLIKSEGSEFEKAVWLFILTYLLVDKSSYFNRKMFVKSTLTQMAAHFNNSYEQLLFLFSEALIADNYVMQEQDTLLSVIRELSTEQTYTGSTHNFRNAEAIALNTDEEILLYFFLLGSLPFNSRLSNESELVSLFESFKKNSPAKATALFMQLAKYDQAREKLVRVLNEELIHSFVTLTEPANADFIIRYQNTINNLPLLKTLSGTGKSLYTTTWQLVLFYLQSNAHSAFNQQTFTEASLLQISKTYAIDLKMLLLICIQGIGENEDLHDDNSRLFYIISSLLKQYGSSTPIELEDAKNIQDKKTSTTQQAEQKWMTLLNNILMYLNDVYAGSGNDKKRKELVAELHNYSTGFSNYIAANPQIKSLIEKSLSSIDQPIAEFYAGENLHVLAKELGIYLNELTHKTNSLLSAELLHGTIPAFITNTSVAITNTATRRIQLRDALLYWLQQDALPWWAGSLEFKTIPELFNELIVLDKTLATLVLKVAFSETISKNRLLSTLDQPVILKLISELPDGGHANEWLTILVELANTINSNQYYYTARSLLVITLLEVYNTHHFSSFEQNVFVSASVKQLAAAWNMPTETLVDLFLSSIKNTGVNYPAALLDLLSSSTLITRKTPAINYHIPTSVNSSINKLLNDLKKKFSSANELLNELESILNYFLLWNKLPDDSFMHDATQTNTFLRELVKLFSHENKSGLKKVLSKKGHSTLARMRLHDLFTEDHSTEATLVKSILVDFFKDDVLQFLKEKNVSHNTTTGLAQLVDAMIAQAIRTGNKQIFETLFSSTSVISFVASQQRDEKFTTFVRLFVNEKDAEFIQGIHYVLNLVGSDKAERETLAGLLREFSLLFFTRHTLSFNPELFMQEFQAFMYTRRQLSSSKFHTALLQSRLKLSGFNTSALASILNNMTLEAKHFSEKEKTELALQKEIEQSTHNILSALENPGKTTMQNEEDSLPEKEENTTEPFEETGNLLEKIYVKNAGLVILHPLLTTYFQRVNLMQDGQFTSKKNKLRAVHLLQYFAWNTEQNAEEELVLNKILCGVRIKTPLPKGIEMTELERSVSDELINVVLMQWDKLKNTSAEGLKASFLQRDGALSETEESYILRVEQRGYDVLLQTLPWSFGMIKTSWMHKPLLVEWT